MTTKEPAQPMQHVVVVRGVHRFKQNAVVHYLLDNGGIDPGEVTEDGVSRGLGPAAGHDDLQVGVVVLAVLRVVQALHEAIIGPLADRAGVEDEHVGLVKGRVAQALVGIGEAGGLDDEILVLREFSGQRLTEELIVVTLRLLRLLFVPDEHADRLRLSRESEEGEEGEEEAHAAGR